MKKNKKKINILIIGVNNIINEINLIIITKI